MSRRLFIQLARRVFVENFFLKFIAAVLALSLFIWVSEDRETIVAGHAPVQMVVPDDMALISNPIDRVKITFRGRWSDINRFDPSNLDPIRIDLSAADSDTVVSITPDRVAVPPTIRVTDIEPDSVYVELEEETYKTVPLRPNITGDPRGSYTVEDVRVSPETITIRGPESRLEEIEAVRTERIDITDRTRSLRREVRADLTDGLITAELAGPIELAVDIVTEETTETLSEVPVEAVNTSYDTSVDPGHAELLVRGPLSVIDELDRELIRAEIDLTEEDDRPPGTYSRPAEVVNLHPDVEVERIHPERFRVVTSRPPDRSTPEEADAGDGDDGGDSL